jgi:hypothetical protein
MEQDRKCVLIWRTYSILLPCCFHAPVTFIYSRSCCGFKCCGMRPWVAGIWNARHITGLWSFKILITRDPKKQRHIPEDLNLHYLMLFAKQTQSRQTQRAVNQN